MSISSEIIRISENISDSFTAVAEKGVSVPSGSTSDDLPGLIRAIQQSGGSGIVVTEEPDTNGGTVKVITAVDLSSDTVDAEHLLTGYTAHDRFGNSVSGSYVPSGSTSTQTKTATPTESQQTITPDAGYLLSSVTVEAISSSYVGSGIARCDVFDMEQEDEYVLAPAGYYADDVAFQTHLGTEGTPTATKGTVNNHSVSITPSVTNSWGYISGGTKTGTAISVSASELVSGSETKTANGTYDVTNLAQLVVNVSGGSDRLVLLQTTALGTLSTSSTSGTDTGKTVSLAQSTGWQNYDLLLVDISVDTKTNGRHTSTVTPVILTGTSNVGTKNTYTVGSNKWNSKLGSTGTASTRQSTTAYGVYINSASMSSNTLTLTVYYKYNNNSTGTLNGTYTARVYGIKLIDLIGG